MSPRYERSLRGKCNHKHGMCERAIGFFAKNFPQKLLLIRITCEKLQYISQTNGSGEMAKAEQKCKTAIASLGGWDYCIK